MAWFLSHLTYRTLLLVLCGHGQDDRHGTPGVRDPRRIQHDAEEGSMEKMDNLLTHTCRNEASHDRTGTHITPAMSAMALRASMQQSNCGSQVLQREGTICDKGLHESTKVVATSQSETLQLQFTTEERSMVGWR